MGRHGWRRKWRWMQRTSLQMSILPQVCASLSIAAQGDRYTQSDVHTLFLPCTIVFGGGRGSEMTHSNKRPISTSTLRLATLISATGIITAPSQIGYSEYIKLQVKHTMHLQHMDFHRSEDYADEMTRYVLFGSYHICFGAVWSCLDLKQEIYQFQW